MRVVYKLALFMLLMNISAYAVAAVTGTPSQVPAGDLSKYDTATLADTAHSNLLTAVASTITGWIYSIPVIGDFAKIIKPVLYIEDTLTQSPFNLGFEIFPGISFAHAIQLVIWFVYAAAIIDLFMHSNITGVG